MSNGTRRGVDFFVTFAKDEKIHIPSIGLWSSEASMSISRRFFLKYSVGTLIAVPFMARLSPWGPAYAADASLPLIKDGEEPGKALKYCSNADKPTKLCDARKAKDKAKQYCYNCQLFTKGEGDKKTASGKCMIIPKNRVHGGAWCMSWVQNPSVKD